MIGLAWLFLLTQALINHSIALKLLLSYCGIFKTSLERRPRCFWCSTQLQPINILLRVRFQMLHGMKGHLQAKNSSVHSPYCTTTDLAISNQIQSNQLVSENGYSLYWFSFSNYLHSQILYEDWWFTITVILKFKIHQKP